MKEHDSFDVPRHIIHSSDPRVNVIRLGNSALVLSRHTESKETLQSVRLLVLITDDDDDDGVILSRLLSMYQTISQVI